MGAWLVEQYDLRDKNNQKNKSNNRKLYTT